MNEFSKSFIERMGVFTEREGTFSRIAGRMLAYFMLDGSPRSLDDIAKDLQISKASASTNARQLEQVGLLERCSTFGDRRDFYRLGESPWENMFAVARRRFEEIAAILEQATARMPDDMEEPRRRLSCWRDFYQFLLEDINERAARWGTHLESQERTADAK